MGHAHGHDHGAHAHAGGVTRAFAIGVAVNLAFVVAEAWYGVLSRSMALVADAGHNLGDVLGLALAGGAALLAQRRPSARRTYGFRRTTILASLVNAAALVLVTGGIAWESARRLLSPADVHEPTVIAVALAGVVVNGATALLFMSQRKRDLNVRSAFLHLASDAALSLGVALAGVVMLATGFVWIDPAVSLVVSALILASTWSVLRGSLNLALDAVPEGIDPDAVRAFLAQLPEVREVHDLHIWALSTTETALTAHVVMPEGACHATFLAEVCRDLHDRFGIEHPTLQVDPASASPCPGSPCSPCAFAPDEVV